MSGDLLQKALCSRPGGYLLQYGVRGEIEDLHHQSAGEAETWAADPIPHLAGEGS